MPNLYSKRWTQPIFPKRDGLQYDFTRERCGGRPVVLTQQKNKFETTKLLNPKHVPVNKIKKFIQSWQPANQRCYESFMKCDLCGGELRRLVRMPTKPYKYHALGLEPSDDELKLKLSDKTMDDMFLAWLNDDNLVETRVPEIDPTEHERQHHMKHHKFSEELSRWSKTSPIYIERICCSECDYPYHLYKRRKPAHLYTPHLTRLPIRPRERTRARSSKFSKVTQIDVNATSEERLRWAIYTQQFDEVRRISTDMFASIVGSTPLRSS